jgi:thiamine-phosphate pyrophosphorylase
MFDLNDRRLYLCTPLRDDLSTFVSDVVRGGVDIVQLREKDAPAAEVLKAALELRRICRDLNVPFIVNDRPDMALDVDADGVHVGQDDVPVADARKLLGPKAIIGLSTHSHAEFDAGLLTSATYLSAGPIVPTPTKPGRAGTGPQFVQYATSRATRPVFLTGGVTPEVVSELASLGVERFVVVRWLTEADDPFRRAQELRRAIDEHVLVR